MCVYECARACVYVYISKNIYFFHQTTHSPAPTRRYCEAIGTVSTNIPELIPRTYFQMRSNKTKQEHPRNLILKQTKPEKPHTEQRLRLLLLLWTKGCFHILKLPYGTKDTKTSPIPSILVIFFLISTKYQKPTPPCAGSGQCHDSTRLSLPPSFVDKEFKAPEKDNECVVSVLVSQNVLLN